MLGETQSSRSLTLLHILTEGLIVGLCLCPRFSRFTCYFYPFLLNELSATLATVVLRAALVDRALIRRAASL